MAKAKPPRRVAVVTGDLTMDWNLARTRSEGSDGSVWNAEDAAHLYWQPGGAALLAGLIEEVARSLRDAGVADCAVHGTEAGRRRVRPDDPRFHHSHAVWSAHPYSGPGDRQTAWRVEEFVGIHRGESGGAAGWNLVADDPARADLVIVDDAGLGFRERQDLWPRSLRQDKCRWVVVKMAKPVAQGNLWAHLHAEHADRLVVVMTVNDLRLTEVQITRELSWERTAQDLCWELVHNLKINALSQCAHVVISFDTAGALLMSRAERPRKRRSGAGAEAVARCRLFFDPLVAEGGWSPQYPGGAIGYTSCLAAGIARQLLAAPDEPDVERGILGGIAAMRALHREGYGGVAGGAAGKEGRAGGSAAGAADARTANLAFPTAAVVRELEAEPSSRGSLTVIDVRDPARAFVGAAASPGAAAGSGYWTILQERFSGGLDKLAETIVLQGPEAALSGVPLARFGKLVTVDRQEIEAFRSIRSLVREYSSKELQQPLSIAVFGAPGSGKSFGVTEVALSVLPGLVRPMSFNLSQLDGPEALLDAFHQVRDVALKGGLPLVFWDEFDSPLGGRELGWLPYFLAPMQDGAFQQGQLMHPIGRCVFVFAGGTCSRMRDFGSQVAADKFKQVKGPDFLSRIKGFVDILGPNCLDDDRDSDPYFIVRRAILLRSILRRDHPQLFEHGDGSEILKIDSGVLRAFLRVGKFEHGVRSIESIVAMSLLRGKRHFERSALPAERQLDLHVNGLEFLARVQAIDLEGELLEQLAAAVHADFCAGLRKQGYRLGAATDDKKKTHSSLKPYDRLPEDEKEQNRDNARDIPNKLAVAGYVMLPARSHARPLRFPEDDLDLLAEMEHDRWVRLKLAAGWRWAAKTDKAQKLHQDLLPWDRLTAAEKARRYSGDLAEALGDGPLPAGAKQKDRALVRAIPAILAKIGYAVVRAMPGKAAPGPGS